MAAMQFRDYVWQNDPESLRIRFRREYQVEPRSDGLWSVTNIARMARTFEGEGVFYGETAYTQFSLLARMLYDGVAGTLVLPHWESARALLTELEILEEPRENYLHYRFAFVELPDY